VPGNVEHAGDGPPSGLPIDESVLEGASDVGIDESLPGSPPSPPVVESSAVPESLSGGGVLELLLLEHAYTMATLMTAASPSP
jgi:hypothetical protein